MPPIRLEQPRDHDQIRTVNEAAFGRLDEADLVDNLLGTDPAVKSGYSISYSPGTGTPVTTYTMLAIPLSTSTGQRYFYTDQSGVIRQTTDASTPTASSTPIG